MPKDFQIHRLFPRRQRFQELPARFGGMSAPGPLEALPGGSSLQVGHKGKRASDEGYIQSHLLQNPLQGVAVRAPVGSVDVVSYGFRKGWSGTTEPVVETTGMYQPADGAVGISVAGTQEALVDSVGLEVAHNVVWKSGTSFKGTLDHANTADRVYTYQNADGTVAFTSDTIALANIEDFAANTILMRNAGTSGDPNDTKISDLTEESAPASGDFLLMEESGGALRKVDWNKLPSSGSSDLVYVATSADTGIASLTDVTVDTQDVTSVGATDKLIVEGSFNILNNSGAPRTYVMRIDFDAAFMCEFTTGTVGASASDEIPFFFRAELDIRSTSLAYGTFKMEGQSAICVGGTDPTLAATNFQAYTWNSTGSNLSSTTTVAFFIRSSSAANTQTCRLHSLTIRKVTPT